jgi:carbamate kinase
MSQQIYTRKTTLGSRGLIWSVGALDFLENGGSRVIITSPHLLSKAMMGEAGTCIYNEEAWL